MLSICYINYIIFYKIDIEVQNVIKAFISIRDFFTETLTPNGKSGFEDEISYAIESCARKGSLPFFLPL